MELFPFSPEINILPFEGEVNYFPEFFTESQSSDLYGRLKNEINWKQEPIWIFGKKVMQPRLTAMYGNPEIPYGYSGIKMIPDSWTDLLEEIKQPVEKTVGIEFTHVLLNYYRDGSDSMGWHRDNEKELGPNPVIASVSFGESRDFQFRHYKSKTHKTTISLKNGSLLVMSGSTQHHWEHQLPKRKKISGGRINLTFRRILI
ncbi:MAG: alpha-ketoglutarate-dependent dioxygenase AlkB [Mongoliibacter sp.]|uniref:alpha-ketoglutarate-dependent dioxygenase AlkB family protein n=1 Tax=Mongoliibacter sp. TaxID=2022438 RepID=UPI0012F18FC4|nr:alpha-ketoglutarate-dependent dioxygenase AlkB [Mongoliibacter sp.]TVP43938.1 MAG: alpha-ketoglutarate-dependent dioxygenase AlkB [Mongoliibacter sp.]